MILKGKRGLSPVIATVLLISITLVLAVIIFLWARHFTQEAVEKDGQMIELVCESVSFDAEIRGSELWVSNTGSIPLYALQLREQSLGEIKTDELLQFGGTLGAGLTTNVTYSPSGGQVLAIPVLIGVSQESDERVPRACEEEYGVDVPIT